MAQLKRLPAVPGTEGEGGAFDDDVGVVEETVGVASVVVVVDTGGGVTIGAGVLVVLELELCVGEGGVTTGEGLLVVLDELCVVGEGGVTMGGGVGVEDVVLELGLCVTEGGVWTGEGAEVAAVLGLGGDGDEGGV